MPSNDPEKRRRYNTTYYERHKVVHLQRVKLGRQKVVEQNRQRLWEYLMEHPCVGCGEKDPVVLEFDHLADDKSGNIARMVGDGWGWDRILAEIQKCEVCCANCHRRRTATRGGWWKILRA